MIAKVYVTPPNRMLVLVGREIEDGDGTWLVYDDKTTSDMPNHMWGSTKHMILLMEHT